MSQEIQSQETPKPGNGGQPPKPASEAGFGRRNIPPEVADLRDKLRNLQPDRQEMLHREMGWVVLHRGYNDPREGRTVEYVNFDKTYESLYRDTTSTFLAASEFLKRISTGKVPFTDERREILEKLTVEGYDEEGNSIAPPLFKTIAEEFSAIRKLLSAATRDMRKAVPNKWLIKEQRRKAEKQEAAAAAETSDAAPELSFTEQTDDAAAADLENSVAEDGGASDEGDLSVEQGDASPKRGRRARAASSAESSETMPPAESTDSGMTASAEA